MSNESSSPQHIAQEIEHEFDRLNAEIASLTARLNEKLYECPECAFTFLAGHTDEGGGYSCPNCAEAKLAQQLAALEWQPIESAPKDETRILGFFPGAPEWYDFSVICWSDSDSDWWGCSPAAAGVCGDRHQPTHWRPLPEPPVSLP